MKNLSKLLAAAALSAALLTGCSAADGDVSSSRHDRSEKTTTAATERDRSDRDTSGSRKTTTATTTTRRDRDTSSAMRDADSSRGTDSKDLGDRAESTVDDITDGAESIVDDTLDTADDIVGDIVN